MGDLGKTLIALGAILAILGVIFFLAQKVSFLGKLPGDIVIRRGNFTLYLPLGTSILISITLSLLLFLAGKCR